MVTSERTRSHTQSKVKGQERKRIKACKTIHFNFSMQVHPCHLRVHKACAIDCALFSEALRPTTSKTLKVPDLNTINNDSTRIYFFVGTRYSTKLLVDGYAFGVAPCPQNPVVWCGDTSTFPDTLEITERTIGSHHI